MKYYTPQHKQLTLDLVRLSLENVTGTCPPVTHCRFSADDSLWLTHHHVEYHHDHETDGKANGAEVGVFTL